MATREKGRKKTKQEAPQEASQQFKVTDPISMVDPLLLDQKLGNWPERKRRKECLKREGKDP